MKMPFLVRLLLLAPIKLVFLGLVVSPIAILLILAGKQDASDKLMEKVIEFGN